MEPNVMVIVCDTLRADILDVYGGEAKTPNINKLARDSVVYTGAIAPSPWTYPSHVSLFTGLYPSEHGVHETKKVKLLDLTKYHKALKAERLAERLLRLGYNTSAISTNAMVSPFTYFDPGFQSFLSIDPAPKNKESDVFNKARKLGSSPFQIAKSLARQGKLLDIVRFYKAWRNINALNKALNYPLDKGSSLVNDILSNEKWESKFFKFINFVEMHEPYKGYKPKETWDNFTGIKKTGNRKANKLKKQYILTAEYLDSSIGNLLKTLKRRGYYDDTLLIITSDHGQAFNEHGYMYHNTYLYDEISHIPLIIKYPNGKKFLRREGYQSIVDIPSLIKNVMEGGDDSALTRETAFSEAYGDVTRLPGGYEHRRGYVVQKYEKVRKAIYKGGFKLTVNGSDGVVEEFLKKGRPVDEKGYLDEKKELLEELDIFKGKEDFKIPGT
ncbi:sulfatase [Candidatus Parvarchaeota archaeon]|nr:sulfatase [Candidatus Parvarchaeota archaeon]